MTTQIVLRKIAIFFWVFVLLLPMPSEFVVSSAFADNSNKNVDINANVVTNCNFNNGGESTIVFGSYNPAGENSTVALTTNTNFDVRCNKGTAVSLRLDPGENPNGSTRRMHYNGEYLIYELYKDAGYTEVWGETVGNDMDYTATSASPHSPVIYAKIAPGQDVSIGTYTDTVNLTASF